MQTLCMLGEEAAAAAAAAASGFVSFEESGRDREGSGCSERCVCVPVPRLWPCEYSRPSVGRSLCAMCIVLCGWDF